MEIGGQTKCESYGGCQLQVCSQISWLQFKTAAEMSEAKLGAVWDSCLADAALKIGAGEIETY